MDVDACTHVLSVEALFCDADKSEDDVRAKDFGKLTNDIYDRSLEQMMVITHMFFGDD